MSNFHLLAANRQLELHTCIVFEHSRHIFLKCHRFAEVGSRCVRLPWLRTFTRLGLAKTATVVFPLSKKVISLLAQYIVGSSNYDPSDTKRGLIDPLKRLL